MNKPSERFNKAKSCIDKIVADWNKTDLSDLEKYSREMYIIWGAVDMALYMLSLDEYNALKEYIYQRYGYNIGGTSGDFKQEALEGN